MQVGNFFIASMIELLAEGMTLAEKNGLSSHHVVQFPEKLFPGHIVKGDIPLCSSSSSQQHGRKFGLCARAWSQSAEKPMFLCVSALPFMLHCCLVTLWTNQGCWLPHSALLS